MSPNLTNEQQQALEQNNGFVQGPSYVLMSIDVYRAKIQAGAQEEMATASDSGGVSDWSEVKNDRRCDLIDKEIEQTITADEQRELARLQQEAYEYRDRISPPPTEGAKVLHRELLAAKRQGS